MRNALNASAHGPRFVQGHASAWQLISLLVCLAAVALVLAPGRPAAEIPVQASTDSPVSQAIEVGLVPAASIDWSRIEAAPEPSPMSVGAYDR